MAVPRALHATTALLLLLVATASAGSDTPVCRLLDCPHYPIIRYYEELGCARSDGSSECCPTRFNCSSLLSLEKSKCYYDGKAYGSSELVETRDACLRVCSCGIDDRREANLNCATPQCLGFVAPEGKESVCYPTYSPYECCGTGLKCANDTKSPRNVTECVYRGKTYLEGQFIEGTSSECTRCVCQQGYDGTLNGPWCRRISCEYFIWNSVHELKRCAPRFSEGDKCCPSGVQCPSDDDTLVRRSEPSTANAGDRCSFGNFTLNVDDEVLAGPGGRVSCRCEVPPFVTCTD